MTFQNLFIEERTHRSTGAFIMGVEAESPAEALAMTVEFFDVFQIPGDIGFNGEALVPN